MKARTATIRNSLSTGSTVLNCACTDNPFFGFMKGMYYFLVGNSSSGKTFLSLTCLAEAAQKASFKNHRFIYDGPENGALMSIAHFFGERVAKRIEAPQYGENNEAQHSQDIEEFYYNLDDAFKDVRPFIYILDSMDSLTSAPEEAKFEERKKAHRKGKKAAGSYTDGKAKINSEYLRKVLTPLKNSESILIIINQTRDNLGMGIGKTRSGGHSLTFYATLELWSSIAKRLTKTVKGKPRQIGIQCKVKVKKNRFTGRENEVEFPIYHSYGIDDLTGCIEYLISEGHWSKTDKGIITAKDFEIKGRMDTIIKHIEKNDLEKDLHKLVGTVWNEIKEACAIKRKSRYV